MQLGTSFFLFLQKKKKKKKTTIFCLTYTKKKWEKNVRPPNWPQLRPPAGQETDFFCGQPELSQISELSLVRVVSDRVSLYECPANFGREPVEGRPESPIAGKSPLSSSLLPSWKENRKVLPVIWIFLQVKIQCYIGIVGNIGIFINYKGSDPVLTKWSFGLGSQLVCGPTRVSTKKNL